MKEPSYWPDIAEAIDGPAPDAGAKRFDERADEFARLLRWLCNGRKRTVHFKGIARRLLALVYYVRPDLLEGATMQELADRTGGSRNQFSAYVIDLVETFPAFVPAHTFSKRIKRAVRFHDKTSRSKCMAAPEQIGDNLYFGYTVAELKVKLRAAQEQLDGFQMSVGAGDTSVTQQQTLSVERRIKLILRQLHLLDPDNYPSLAPVKRTRPRYML